MLKFNNPFKPGAGHMPPCLAGRELEQKEFQELLAQETVLKNLILTGLRGVGKTVLLETLKPLAFQSGWLWVGTDMSESASISEERLATRILADLSVVTSSFILEEVERRGIGFSAESHVETVYLDYSILQQIYINTAGLMADKLKSALEFVWQTLRARRPDIKGIVFAYDEAQNLSDHAEKEQYPSSLLLEVFQSLQRKNVHFMLVLCGLPTLFPKLVEARTYSERMFHQIFLKQLDLGASRLAILQPINDTHCPIKFSEETISRIIELSGGYPYFIQFICRELFDIWIQQVKDGSLPRASFDAIVRKLDTDFFAGRWSHVTDRQRELLAIVAQLPNADEEFSVQEVSALSEELSKGEHSDVKPFKSSHTNQMFSKLIDQGLLYKNRHGKYSFAVPLLSRFIRRQV